MKDILKAIAKLLTIKNVVSLIVLASVIYFVYLGQIKAAVITSLLSVAMGYVFSDKSD